ncbi:hypothetical protein [Corynebacterium freiburgense]|uniref:hypothetical protein n=1 Tax=Corynebacterium freiburgense TaxID=556548 RepID=UPI000423F3F6|nr:hypothetical protein [Corynebacterium freiburgense]WJZ01717.1 hypothetical protein CFREI_02065 [Corynebacterium freiburgense]
MSGFEFDPVVVHERLDRLIADFDGRHRSFADGGPSFPVEAAGRGFADYGRRIAAMLNGIHAAGEVRTGRLVEGCRFARDSVLGVCDSDGVLGSELRGLW